MPHIHAASALLVLSLPYALAIPVAQEVPNPLLPAFQLLGGKLPTRSTTRTSAATPSPVLNLAAPLSAVNSIINPSALVNLVAPINALLVSSSVSAIPSVPVSVPTLSSTSISIPSLSSISISLPTDSSVSISISTLTSAVTSVTDLSSIVAELDGVSAVSILAAIVSSEASAVSDAIADLSTTIDVSLPTTAASDISSLTGGVLTSPDVTSPDATSPDESVESTSTEEPLESSSSELVPDPEFQGGPENELINPVPNPIGPTPTPVEDDDVTETDASSTIASDAELTTEAPDALETEAAPLNGSIPSETVEISAPFPSANTTDLFNATLLNSSEPIVTDAPTSVFLTEPTEEVSINTSDDFVVVPLETEIPAPFPNTTGSSNATLTNSTLANSSEPVVTDEATPILLPVPTDDIFIDPLLPTDDVLVDSNTEVPIETDLPLPEEPDVTDTSSEPVELFNPPKDSVELSTFIDIMQGIANVLSSIFHVIPEDVEPTVADDFTEDDDAADDDTAEDTIPGVPEPELNIPDVPVPLINATDNATILERRQFTGATPKLDPVIVSDIMRSVLEIITTIFKQVTAAVPAVAAAVPNLPVELPSDINPKLPTTILPILPTDVPQLDLPTDIDWDDLPELTELPNVAIPSVALPNIALPNLPVVPSLPVLPTLAAALPTGGLDGLLADIPGDLPTGTPSDLFADLPGFAPVETALPSIALPTAVINNLPTGVADLPTELPTDLPEDLFGDLPTTLPTDLTALANGVTRLAKRASTIMTAEQEQLLSVIHANNAELQDVLNQLKAMQQSNLRKRQNAGVYAGAEAGFTGPQLFPVILNLIDTLLGIVNGLGGVKTIAPNDLNTLLSGALGSATGLVPGAPVVPVTGLGGLGSLGGLEAPVVPVPVASVVPVLDGALGSLGGLAAPLVSGVPPVVPSLVPGLDLGALGSIGGLAAPVVSGVPAVVPSLVPSLDLGALGSLGGLAAPIVSGVPAVVPSLVPAVDLGALGSLGGLGAAVVSSVPSILPLQTRDEPIEGRQLVGALGGLGSVGGLGGVISNTKPTSVTGVAPATPLAGLVAAASPVVSPVVNLLNGLLAGGSVAGLAPVVNPAVSPSSSPSSTPFRSPSASPSATPALNGLLGGGSAAGLVGVVSSLPLVSALPIVNSLPVNSLLNNVENLPVVSPVADVLNGVLDNTLPELPTLPTADPLALLGDVPAASPVAGVVNGLFDNPLPELPNLASVLPVASVLPAVLNTVDAVAESGDNILAGNSAAGLAPVASAVAGLNGLLPGGQSVNGVLGNASPLVDPVPEGVAPALHAVNPLVDPVSPLVNTPLPILNALDPVYNLAAPVDNIVQPIGQAVNPILSATPPLLSAAAPLVNNLVPVVTPLAPVADLVGGLLNPGAQLPGLDTLTTSPVGPVAPGTNAVNSILPEVALKQIQGVLATLRRLLGIPDSTTLPFSKRDAPVSVVPVLPQPQIFASLEHDSIESVPDNAAHVVKALLHSANTKRYSELTKNAQAPAEKRQIFTNAAVKKFLLQWHTIGASMAKVSPQTVNDLMQVFMDPSSNPPTPANLQKYDASLRSFIQSFYIFAQYMDDAGVSAEEKIQMLRIMFDDTSMNAGFKKTKRSMRYGRRQLGIAEDGEPDTGPSLDDAEKFGHNALLALVGPSGSLDPLELFRPQDRVYDPIEYDEESSADSTGATDDSESTDDSAWGDDAASTDDSEPTQEEYDDYMDYFADSH